MSRSLRFATLLLFAGVAFLLAADAAFLLAADAAARPDPPKDADKKDVKKDPIYYTVEKEKGGILKVVVRDTTLGDKEVKIDTNPKNSAGISQERPVAVEVSSKEEGKEFTLVVLMAPGGTAVKSVSWNKKDVALGQLKKKPPAPKEPAEKK